jgi:3-hydroxyisobutyrate dehydrogenase-like beta-hydroxyacid dehydrogenase
MVDDRSVAKVAVVGLGAMGSRIARRLLDAGHELTVWNRTRASSGSPRPWKQISSTHRCSGA